MIDLSDDYNKENESQSGQSSSTTKRKESKKRQGKPKVEAIGLIRKFFKLIICVECLPLLWNAQDEKYKNRVARKSSWKDMSELDFEYKFTDNELQAKWTNLRIQYRSYLARSENQIRSRCGRSCGLQVDIFRSDAICRQHRTRSNFCHSFEHGMFWFVF